jgi:phage terminase small subunit
MPGGRPAKPLERKRKTGRAPGRDSGGRKLPEVAQVVALPMAGDAPEPPLELGLAGRELWGRVWAAGISWISPDSDWDAAVRACRLKDAEAAMAECLATTRQPEYARAFVAISKELGAALGVLGFDPSARSRLGVAEVRRESALDELLRRKAAQ